MTSKSTAHAKTVTVTQVKSSHGRKPGQKETLVGLGLGKMRDVSTLKDTPDVRGMIRAVHHLIEVKESK